MERNNIIISRNFLDVICQIKLYNWATKQKKYANLIVIIEEISDKIMKILQEEKREKIFSKYKITLEQNTEESMIIFIEKFKRWLLEMFPHFLEPNNAEEIILLRDELIQNIIKVQK